jgi:hypothetical protein
MSVTNSFNNAFPPMQVQAMNGSSPQNAAFNNFIQGQKAAADLSKLAGGKRRQKKYRGGQVASNSVVVPQAILSYTDKSYPSINGPDGIIAKLVSTSNQSAANAKYDNAVLKGGSRKATRKATRKAKRKVKKIKGRGKGTKKYY